MNHLIVWLALTVLMGAPGAARADAEGVTGEPGRASLPLAKVLLYSSGVGYFQHDGEVQGRARLDLSFRTEAVNDLLKSLVVQDFGGGRISTVRFDSRDPLAKTLQSFGINLTSNPTLAQLLDQIRGERIEVAAPTAVTGTILGVESKPQPVGQGNPPAVVNVEYLNLVTDEGLRSIALGQVQRIRLLNERLNGELAQALAVLATGHDTRKKTVAVTCYVHVALPDMAADGGSAYTIEVWSEVSPDTWSPFDIDSDDSEPGTGSGLYLFSAADFSVYGPDGTVLDTFTIKGTASAFMPVRTDHTARSSRLKSTASAYR